MFHRLRVQYVSAALLLGSAVCLGMTVWVVASSGGIVYFLTFHAPLHVQLTAASPAYHQSPLPSFGVQAAISETKPSRGGAVVIHTEVTPRQTARAYLEIWVRGPNNREVYKYPANIDAAHPLQFIAAHKQTFDETYTVPASAPAGKYTVSASIVSDNEQVDYYNAHNFASFEVL